MTIDIFGKWRGWVSDQAVVDAKYAHGDGVAARGVVISFTNEPTVGIRRADGSVVNWLARLCRPATEEEAARFAAAVPPARRSYSIRPGTARRLGIRPPRV